ncbi:hypothetical protein [Microbacterium elymi]|uniref:hypothetical protein n=1 Tax=Microbacterium elymi TaxID=2909587 RepID=UPI00338D5B82
MELDTTLSGGQRVAFRVSTRYPFDERITITPTRDLAAPITLTLRIPAWAAGSASVTVNGQEVPITGATVAVTRAFQNIDAIELILPLEPRFTWPHPSVDAVRGQVAVESGPLVLALEDVDLPDGITVDRVTVDTEVDPVSRGGGARVRLRVHPASARDWPFGQAETSTGEPLQADLIPYFRWANRGPSTMRVWLPTSQRG